MSIMSPRQWKPGIISKGKTHPQSARRHPMWAIAHSTLLWRQSAVRSRPRQGRRACRWVCLRWFLTVWTKVVWICKLIAAAAVRPFFCPRFAPNGIIQHSRLWSSSEMLAKHRLTAWRVYSSLFWRDRVWCDHTRFLPHRTWRSMVGQNLNVCAALYWDCRLIDHTQSDPNC